MIEIRKKLKVKPGAYQIKAKGRLELPFEQRSKSRSKAVLVGGEEVALHLPRGEMLRGGDLVVASDGRVIEVHAVAEKVLHITCASPSALAKAAYHLGNRHVAVEVGEGWMRIAADHVLEDMLRGLGATVSAMQAAFEPESGAYAGGDHAHDENGRGGKIHEYGEHDDEHGHVHGPDCGHDHGRAHAHDHDHEHEHDHKHEHDHDHDHDHKHDHDHDHQKVIAVVKKHAHVHEHEHDKEHAHHEAHANDKKHKHH
jgi:urease accessory protein